MKERTPRGETLYRIKINCQVLHALGGYAFFLSCAGLAVAADSVWASVFHETFAIVRSIILHIMFPNVWARWQCDTGNQDPP